MASNRTQARNRGKQFERDIAKMFGGRRGYSSNPQDDFLDVIHPTLAIECKARTTMPKWLMDVWGEIGVKAKKTNKIPVICMREKGKEPLAIVSAEWLAKILEKEVRV